MDGQWSDWSGKDISPIKKPIYNYDRMVELEEYTDYNFPISTKATVLVDELGTEATQTASSIDNFFTNVGDGLMATSQLIKYLPIILVAGFVLYINKKGSK